MSKLRSLIHIDPRPNSIEPIKTKIKVATSNRIHILTKSDILYLQSDSNYCQVVLIDGQKLICSQTLKSIQEKLNSPSFYRPHNSYVFNMQYLDSVSSNMNELFLKGDICIPISRSNRAALRTHLDAWYD